MIVSFAAAAWFAFLGADVALGGLRDRVLAPHLGDGPARRLCTLVLCLFILLGTWGFAAAAGLHDAAVAWRVGAAWTLATLGLETAMGRFLLKLPWSVILADYAMWRGRLWVLAPLATLTAPALVLCLRG
jgi:hypothetical protein